MRFLKSLLFFTLTLFVSQTFAQKISSDSLWTTEGIVGVNISNVSLVNWNGGGQSAISGNAFGNYKALRETEISKWETTLALAYGIQNTEETGTRKTDDRIEFSTKYGAKAFGSWLYTGLLTFRSQFQPGYQYPNDSTQTKISNFLAPAYLQASIGLENEVNEHLSVYISPVTAKFTIVADDDLNAVAAYGVDTNQVLRSEFGGSIRLTYSKEIMKNVKYTSTLDLFSNYAENPQNIDVNFDNMLTFKVNDYINASFAATFIYDDDINFPIDRNDDGINDGSGPRTQQKYVLNLGLQYKF